MQQSPPIEKKHANNSTAEKRRSLGWLLLAIALLLSIMFAQQGRAANTDLKESGSGQLYLQAHGRQFEPAVHLATDVTMDIKGLNAAVVVQQSFTNSSDEWVEGVYVFPLPENSAVNFMQLKVGERLIKGEIKEKRQAQKIYNEAKSAGKKTALVEQERPNLFTQSVANIAPGETITVELHYLQTLEYDQGLFAVRFPMTLTPRYIPGAAQKPLDMEQRLTAAGNGWAQPTDSVPDADRITPYYLPPEATTHNAVTLKISLDPGMPLSYINSSSHPVQVEKPSTVHDYQHQILLMDDHSGMDRDFVLEWRPLNSRDATAAIFHEQHGGDSFVQVMLLPPHSIQQSTILARELVLIVDTSGSMQGPSIVQARQSLLWALDALKPDDHFNIIAFDSFHRELFPKPVAANSQNLRHARTFVKQLHASGGTEMAPALRAALAYPVGEERLKQIVFITDGSVGNEAELFALIDENLDGARLFTVGIGSAPNSYFMRKAAEFGRGSFTYIGDTQQVNEKMSALFRKLENPVMAGIDIQWPGASAVREDMFPKSIPDLYLGEPLFVTARIPNGLAAGTELTISGRSGHEQWQRHLVVPEKNQGAKKIIATQWARQKISNLLDQKVKGLSESEVRKAVLEVALPYQLLSPYSSFVAVEESVFRTGDKPLHSKPVLNQLPAGQVASALMYPQTATPASLNMLLGLLALSLLWAIRRGLGHA